MNELVDLLESRGATVTRSQLLAVLVVFATVDSDRLIEMITNYRGRSAGATVLQQHGPINIAPRRPGRRPSL